MKFYTAEKLTADQVRKLVQGAVHSGLLAYPNGQMDLPSTAPMVGPVRTWSEEKAMEMGMSLEEFKAYRKLNRVRRRVFQPQMDDHERR